MSKDRPNLGYATDLASQAVSAQRPLEWFDSFYREASGNAAFIPWADMEPNPNLVDWTGAGSLKLDCGKAILVVGCGLGDDAAYLAKSGSTVTAFDVSQKAIEWACNRFERRTRDLHFVQADLLNLPPAFHGAYNLVVEIYTIQVLREELRCAALQALAGCLDRDGGVLLIICRGRDDEEPFGELPWGVSKRELAHLEEICLEKLSFEDYIDPHTGSRRFRAEYGWPQE